MVSVSTPFTSKLCRCDSVGFCSNKFQICVRTFLFLFNAVARDQDPPRPVRITLDKPLSGSLAFGAGLIIHSYAPVSRQQHEDYLGLEMGTRVVWPGPVYDHRLKAFRPE